MKSLVTFPDRTRGTVRRAEPDDAEAIRRLYDAVYAGKYTLPEATEPDAIRAKIADGALWTLCFHRKARRLGDLLSRPEAPRRAYAAAVLQMQGRT
jgi:hypothetical protein